MGRAIHQFYFEKMPTMDYVAQELRRRTGLDIKMLNISTVDKTSYCFINCDGFSEIEFELNAENMYGAAIYDMIFFKLFKKGEETPYLKIMLCAVLMDFLTAEAKEKMRPLPDWVNKKWADIGWFTKRRSIYK